MFKECVFCREISGSRETNFAKLYPELSSRVIAETESFIAFPCIGQLIDGHFLVIPKIHNPTIAQSLFGDGSLKGELQSILSKAHKFINMEQEQSLYFEHGALGAEHGGCGIYHAHLHVLPNAGGINCRDLFAQASDSNTSNLFKIYSEVLPEKSYAIIGSDEMGFHHWQLSQPLESQTIRKYVANCLGTSEWDWRKSGSEKNMHSLLSRISA